MTTINVIDLSKMGYDMKKNFFQNGSLKMVNNFYHGKG